MPVLKFLNPNYVEGGTEPKYLPLTSSGGGDTYIGTEEPINKNIWINPENNTIKYRYNGVWLTSVSETEYVEEAPKDGTLYARLNGAWATLNPTITVQMVTNQSDNSDLDGIMATVSYENTSVLVANNGEINVPLGTDVTITFPNVVGYATPKPLTFTALFGSVTKIGTYNTTIVTVGMDDNQDSYDDVASATATVVSTNINTSVNRNGTVKIPTGAECTITWNSVSGYRTPASQTFTATGTSMSKTGVYETEILTLNVTGVNSGFTITVGSLGSQTAVSQVWKVPFGTSYTISASSVNGYTAPSSVSYTANQVSRSVTMAYTELQTGIYIANSNGTLTPYASWTSSSGTAVGVAVVTDKCKFIMDLTVKTSIAWSNDTSTDIPAIPTTTDSSTAATYYDGVAYTDAMIAANSSTSYAAGYARSKSISYGGKTLTGYVGSSGEWQAALDNHSAVLAAFAKVGITLVASNSYRYFWSSCEYSSGNAWHASWDEYSSRWSLDYSGKSHSRSYYCVVPFYKL